VLRALPLLLLSCALSSFGTTIFSGPQNLALQGVPNTLQTLVIPLAGVVASWDTLKLSIAATANSSLGGNDVIPSAGVALSSTTGTFPAITDYNFGDPFPSSPFVGSGTEILWGNGVGVWGDGSGYAAMVFGTQGGGPTYWGWLHLNIQNSALPTATLTVLDWSYSDVVGQAPVMGQVPEPSSVGMTAFGLLGTGLVFLTRRGLVITRRKKSALETAVHSEYDLN
jgi:hypothetical protein